MCVWNHNLLIAHTGGIVTFEYTRSNMSAARKEADKERNRQQFREVILRLKQNRMDGWMPPTD